MTQQEYDRARVLKEKIETLDKQMTTIKNVLVSVQTNIPDSGLRDIIYELLKVSEGRHLISNLLEKVLEDYNEKMDDLQAEFAAI